MQKSISKIDKKKLHIQNQLNHLNDFVNLFVLHSPSRRIYTSIHTIHLPASQPTKSKIAQNDKKNQSKCIYCALCTTISHFVVSLSVDFNCKSKWKQFSNSHCSTMCTILFLPKNNKYAFLEFLDNLDRLSYLLPPRLSVCDEERDEAHQSETTNRQREMMMSIADWVHNTDIHANNTAIHQTSNLCKCAFCAHAFRFP